MPLTADDLEILRRELSELLTTRPRTVTKQRAIAELAPEPAAAQPKLHRRGSGAVPGGQGACDDARNVARISAAQPE